MARTVILVPYRSDNGGRRDELYGFVDKWLRHYHHRYTIYLGESPDGPFNRGAAINDAARAAGEWDFAIVHDADTLIHPPNLQRSVSHVVQHPSRIVYPFSSYIYCDEQSSTYILSHPESPWFICPESHSSEGFRTTVRHHHVSGAMVMSRAAYEAVGGFIELEGWGAEDLIMHALFTTFVGDAHWVDGGAYHLWHPAKRNDPEDKNNVANHDILADVLAMSVIPDQLKKYLQDGGHPIP